MYGAIFGDIIGSRFEFDRGPWTKEFELLTDRCNWTDDSVMTIAVMEALMNAGKDTGDAEELHVHQWMPYEEECSKNKVQSSMFNTEGVTSQRRERSGNVQCLESLQDYMLKHSLDVLHSSTQIIIAPGYKFHIVQMMVTNFHQPQSTLLLLVSAFVNGNWRKIYDYALGHDFRFLSYGDSSLLIP